MLFQLLLTNFSKSELFSCSQKIDHVTNYCKRPVQVYLVISSEKRVVPYSLELPQVDLHKVYGEQSEPQRGQAGTERAMRWRDRTGKK